MTKFRKCPACGAEVMGGADEPHYRADTDLQVACNGKKPKRRDFRGLKAQPVTLVSVDLALAPTPDMVAMDQVEPGHPHLGNGPLFPPGE